MSTFGEKLRKLRKEKKWSQDDLAQKINIHGRHVGKYEIGNVLPNAETAIKIARVFNVSLDYLFIDEESDHEQLGIIDKELLQQFRHVETMEEEDRHVIKSLIDAYIKKQQIEAVLQN